MLNQLLVKDFTIDSITTAAQQTTFAPGIDHMADYDEWLFIQVSENSDYTYRPNRKINAPMMMARRSCPEQLLSSRFPFVGEYSDARMRQGSQIALYALYIGT